MVSYDEYSTIPTSDFDSYSNNQEYEQMLNTSSTYMDGAFTCGFEPTGLPAFANTTQSHTYGTSNFDASLKQPGSPAGSFHSACLPHLSSSSDTSVSVSSSTIGSPSSHQPQFQDTWSTLADFGMDQSTMSEGFVSEQFSNSAYGFNGMTSGEKLSEFVNPNVIQSNQPSTSYGISSPYPEIRTPRFPQPPSPALSNSSISEQVRFKVSGSQSPYINPLSFLPTFPSQAGSRRMSQSSILSKHSASSRRSGSFELDDETREKGVCPYPECGRIIKDLKAHILTHQNERPEKCPIVTCEYHLKGFARKYDKNRHTLTHYKGTMVCGFCPGSGSSAEKSFNRADVFKRHLTAVHGVEQNPPNSRKKSPAAPVSKKTASSPASTTSTTGTCSTCSVTFANAQDFYEHLDECVLRVVQQADPIEENNQRLLGSVAQDKDTKDSLDIHALSNDINNTVINYDDDDDEEDDEDNDNDDDNCVGNKNQRSGKGSIRSTRQGNSRGTKATNARGGNRVQKAGLTFSKRGVKLSSNGRKKRKNYPISWGCPIDKMKMKKRVLCVYDGQRRLWKDDMMLDSEFEVRLPLGQNQGYITDLDIQTLKRAEAVLDTNEEERGPWNPDNLREFETFDGIGL